MRSPRSRNAAPSSPSDDDRCRAGGGVGGVATGDDAARGGIDSSAGAPPRKIYARSLYSDEGATLDDLREAATTLAEIEPTARRVLGGAHPTTGGIEAGLRDARAALRARKETPPPGGEA